MADLRDYRQWHHAYDDPESDLSWRLRRVQSYLRSEFDARSGRVRILSLCAGDGRDVIGVLRDRVDRDRFDVTLVEIDEALASTALLSAQSAAINAVDVRCADAADTSSYADTVPADVLLLVGIFGNISDADLARIIAAAPGFCRVGASLIWSRGRDRTDRNDFVRASFADVGFEEIDYASRENGSRPALGLLRYGGPPVDLTPTTCLFTFDS